MKIQQLPPELSSQAIKKIKSMNPADKLRIKEGIFGIPKGDIRRLEGAKGSFRLRVGKWRVLFSWVSDEQILVEKIDSRGQVYKGA
ncbi:MAG: type II toxin-antitoxin system RelE/ParE family toxin [Defluviitaleaceae bacterium]|nr:type II toxin-antitoxin system RelE/ParE family toxin [Defluviitaleaceae bacterium]